MFPSPFLHDVELAHFSEARIAFGGQPGDRHRCGLRGATHRQRHELVRERLARGVELPRFFAPPLRHLGRGVPGAPAYYLEMSSVHAKTIHFDILQYSVSSVRCAEVLVTTPAMSISDGGQSGPYSSSRRWSSGKARRRSCTAPRRELATEFQ